MNTATRAISTALAVILTLAGCGGKNASHEASAGKIPSGAVTAGLKAVPTDAFVVVSITSPESFWDMIVGQGIVPVGKEQAAALNTAMRAHVQEHLGLDVRGVQSILVFGNKAGGAAVIRPVEGTLKGAEDQDGLAMVVVDANEDVVAALHKKTLLVGRRASVLASAATLQGESPAFAGDFADFAQTQLPSSYVAAAADLSQLPIPLTPFTQGLRYGGLKIDNGGIHVTTSGEPATLAMLKTQMESFVDLGLSTLKTEMESSRSEFARGAGAILAYYNAESLASALEPVVAGNTLRIDFDMLGGGANTTMIVAGVGILAAVAIPAFMKYMKKSKTAEASQFLKKMSDSARTHYAVPPMDDASLALGAQAHAFPASVGPTPPLGTCCATGDKCIPTADTWQHPTWQALDFAMHGPHYYSYEFKSEINEEGVASYTALAYGDLDCDGVYSTFSLYGEVVDGEPVSASDVIKQNALE